MEKGSGSDGGGEEGHPTHRGGGGWRSWGGCASSLARVSGGGIQHHLSFRRGPPPFFASRRRARAGPRIEVTHEEGENRVRSLSGGGGTGGRRVVLRVAELVAQWVANGWPRWWSAKPLISRALCGVGGQRVAPGGQRVAQWWPTGSADANALSSARQPLGCPVGRLSAMSRTGCTSWTRTIGLCHLCSSLLGGLFG